MKLSHLITFLATSLIVLVNNVTSLELENIIGGRLSRLNDNKYQVSIHLGKTHICGGALIAPNVVLTAAHCFYDKQKMTIKELPYVVVAGTINSNNDTYSSSVTKIYVHKDYKKLIKGKVLNDIALLRLENDFDVSGSLPIDLALLPQKNDDFTDKTAIVSGYGWDKVNVKGDGDSSQDEIDGASSGKLKHEFVKLVGPEQCGADTHPNLLCGQMVQSTNMHQGVCSGDSGGPLMFGNKIIGIVSTSPIGCDESRQSATYTKVSEFLDFIQDAVRDKQRNDMLVKSINSVSFDIPFFKLKGITSSPELQSVLTKLQVECAEFEAALENLQKLIQSKDDAEKVVNALEKTSQDSHEKYNEYIAKYKEYKTKFDVLSAYSAEVKKLNAKVNESISKVNELNKNKNYLY